MLPAPSSGYVAYPQLLAMLQQGQGQGQGNSGNALLRVLQQAQGSPQGPQGVTTPTSSALGIPSRQPLAPVQPSGPNGVLTGLNQARQGISSLNTLDQTTGSNFNTLIKSLLGSGGTGGVGGFPGAVSDLSSATGAGAGAGNVGVGAATMGSQGLEGGVSGTGTGAGTGGSALGGAASALGLIASLYGLASGEKVTPEMLLGILQGGLGTAATGASLAASAGLSGAAGLAESLGGVVSDVAPGFGLLAGIQNIADATNKILTHDPRAQYDAYSQLVGGPGAGYLSHLITQNMPSPNAALNRSLGASGLGIEQYRQGLTNAGASGDIRQIQQALGQLGSEEWGRGAGSIGAHLNLPSDVAQALGVAPNAGFRDLSTDQFARLVKAYSEREGLNRDWFTGTADMPHFRTDSGEGPNVTRALSGTVSSVFDALMKHYAPALQSMSPVAPLTWENVGNYRTSPQLQYSAVDTVNRGQDDTYHPVDYATLKNLLLGGGNGKDPKLKAGGALLASGGVPTSLFEISPERSASLRNAYQSYLESLSPAYRSDYIPPPPGGDQ